MNHHHVKANELAGPCDEHQDLRDPIGTTKRAPEQRESPHYNVRNPGPLPHHNRHASGVPSLVASDSSSAEESRECWMSNNVDSSSSSSGWECSSMPALSQMPLLPPAAPALPTIEISPGVQVCLRGADETWKAIENDYYMPAECICCESTIFCIQDADYVLCPDCRVVSRMEGISSRGMGGVGLGFKYEALARWQDAILRDQLYRRPHV
jgi:hypothetical protein